MYYIASWYTLNITRYMSHWCFTDTNEISKYLIQRVQYSKKFSTANFRILFLELFCINSTMAGAYA